jgi:hypothetical protein
MNTRKFICTYFDSNYLPRGLALYYSIKQYHKDFEFFVLTFDKQSYDYLTSLKEENIRLISADTYNSYFNTSADRFTDKKQYFFSATPNLCTYVLDNYKEVDILLYLDADVYLFDSLDSLYDEFGDSSIGITEHRVNKYLKLFVKHYGHFVIGVNLFRRSEDGLKCLSEWKHDCESWYAGKPGYPLTFFSDQIFLDSWMEKYSGVRIIKNIGINTSYWNAANYTFKKINNQYFVDNQPLIIFHFSSLRKEDENTWNAYSIYGLASVRNVLLEIYQTYIKHIESFGLSNRKWVKVNHKESLQKRIAHYVLNFFINEKIIVSDRKNEKI